MCNNLLVEERRASGCIIFKLTLYSSVEHFIWIIIIRCRWELESASAFYPPHKQTNRISFSIEMSKMYELIEWRVEAVRIRI